MILNMRRKENICCFNYRVCQSLLDVLNECEQSSSPDNPFLTIKDCNEKLRLLKAGQLETLGPVTYSKEIENSCISNYVAMNSIF